MKDISDMKELIEWLLSLERLANSVYREAADVFAGDAAFAAFLGHLATDEQWHREVMKLALQEMGLGGGPVASIGLDHATKERIEQPFQENLQSLSSGTISKQGLLECVVRTEYSEWNDIFLYVVNSLKERREDFLPVAARMQEHMNHINTYLERVAVGDPVLSGLRRIPPVWQARILVVDDYHPIREFLSTVLARFGVIDTAQNGKEGLALMETRPYEVIVTDVDMPVMKGTDMFLQAERRWPGIGKRFLFLSGVPDSEEVDLIRGRSLRFLAKPVLINDIEGAVQEIMRSSIDGGKRLSAVS